MMRTQKSIRKKREGLIEHFPDNKSLIPCHVIISVCTWEYRHDGYVIIKITALCKYLLELLDIGRTKSIIINMQLNFPIYRKEKSRDY